MAENKSSNKIRNRGHDWQAIARGRANMPRVMRTTRGLTNVPNVTEVGSAAYRRMQAKAKGKRR